MNGESRNIKDDNISKLREIFPEVFNEDKIDFEKLKVVLGENIDKKDEKYSFTWNGKMNALRYSQIPSNGTLRPCKEESKNWAETKNIYIEGDNLEILKLLQNSYLNKIKVIYIDPPYNTGNDFIYKDNFKDNINNYKRYTGQIDDSGNLTSTKNEKDGRYHTNWLNMMYPRLRLSRNLLKDNGMIFISVSDKEAENLKKICNEIYGDDNFAADIIWNSTKSVTNTALISVSHTHTFLYFKNAEYYKTHREEFRLKEDGSGFSNPDNDSRGLWKADPYQVGGWRPNQQYEIINPKTGAIYRPNPNCSWKNDYKKFKELMADNRIVFGVNGESGPQRKRFIWEAKERGKVAKTLWDDIETTTNGTQQIKNLFDGKSVFDNPKPVGLLKKILELSTDNNDIVLDFFSGSATTGHACMEMNADNKTENRFILIQLPEKIDENSKEDEIAREFLKEHNLPMNLCEIGKERIRRAGEKIKSDIERENNKSNSENEPRKLPDIGFRVFKLDTSNVKKWEPDIENLEESLLNQIDNFVEGRNELDILYEIILKCGFELTVPVEEMTIKGKRIYSVDFGKLIVCTENNVTLDIAEEIVKMDTGVLNKKDITVVFKDNGFENDSIKTNIKETMKSFGIGKFITI